jgi:glycosyltransferase involved in cell wall biosynthesis
VTPRARRRSASSRDYDVESSNLFPDVTFICGHEQKPTDGIRDHAIQLSRALSHTAQATTGVLVTAENRAWTLAARSDDPGLGRRRRIQRTIVFEYNPFSFGRYGFAPWLLLRAWRLRRAEPTPCVVLLVHEAFVPASTLRALPLAAWQRLQLALLRGFSDVTLASTERLTERLARWWPARPTRAVHVGSNLPDMRHMRQVVRARLGLPSDAIIVATFGTAHPSHSEEHVRTAVSTLADAATVWVIHLGSGAARFGANLPRVRQIGHLSADGLASYLAAADVFLAPFTDGVSTRRTTLVAALQHELAVVGTRGPSTDKTLDYAGGPLRLVSTDALDLFAQEVRRLVDDRHAIRELGHAGRALYEAEFAWQVIAERFMTLVRDA